MCNTFKVVCSDCTTPLHCAAYDGNLRLVRDLLEDGIDKHAKNAVGATALDVIQELIREIIRDIAHEHGGTTSYNNAMGNFETSDYMEINNLISDFETIGSDND